MGDDKRVDAGLSASDTAQGASEYLNMGTSIALGVALGLIIGAMLDNPTWGLLIGAALGVVLGAVVEAQRRSR
jgi:F0F1-type ATP synthase assembly protein I